MFNPSLSMYRWAKLASGMGMFLLVFHASLPQLLSFNLSHIFLFSGWGLEFCAYCIFLQRKFWQRPILSATIFASVLFQILSYFDIPNTIALSTFFGGCIYGGMGIVFLSHRVNQAWILRFLGFFDFTAAAVFFLRTLERFLILNHIPSFSPTTVNTVLYGMGFFAMIVNSFGFLLLVKQADELRLQQAFEELQQSEAEQRQLLAMATHEFRLPLSVIDSSAQLLAKKFELDEKGTAIVARIRRGVKRLTSFLDNCLTEDRLDNKNLVPHFSSVDLVALAQWGKENAAFISAEHTIMLIIDKHLPKIQADQHLLRVMLINVLSNAIKFSPAKSEIILKIEVKNKAVALTVIDQGQGIPPDEIPSIFEKYVRGRAVGMIPGAGLGLSIVKRIAMLHNASISIHSEVGNGTAVTMTFSY